MDILIVTKALDCKGGVANYFRLFFRKYRDADFSIRHFCIGSRSDVYDRRNKRHLGYFADLLKDVVRFIRLMIADKNIRIVQVNPSLIPVALFRDGIFILLARLFGRKIIVFFRGWRDGIADRIDRNKALRRLFKMIFLHSDAHIVLAGKFRERLLNWGVDPASVYVTYTMYDEDLVVDAVDRSTNIIPRLLFLSRVSEPKGTWELVEATGRLKKLGFEFKLDIYGHAAEQTYYKRLKERARELKLDGCVSFNGFVDGEKKFRLMAEADIFLLPSWEEGCPNSVLEAMASGCFIVCTAVGALPEVVEDSVNGTIIKVNDIDDFTAKLVDVLSNLQWVRERGLHNRDYAKEKFSSKVIIEQFRDIYKGIGNEN